LFDVVGYRSLSVEMKVTFVNQKLCRHCAEIEIDNPVASITAVLADVWPVPAGFSTKLVYENKALVDYETLSSIGYFPGKCISVFSVKTPAQSTQGSMPRVDSKLCRNQVSLIDTAATSLRVLDRVRVVGLNDWHWDWRIDGVHASPAMNGRTGVICGPFNSDTGRWTIQIDGSDSSEQTKLALRPCNLKLIGERSEQTNAPITQLPETHSASKPTADELRDGSRVRVDGLVSKPAMNGRTGVICGPFNSDTGRWTIQIDGSDSSEQTKIALRPCNLKLIEERSEQTNAPITQLPETHSASKPTAYELRDGSRVRVDGLVSKPSMNGRTGVICGPFNSDTGRWTIQIDGSDSSEQTKLALRSCNIKLLPVYNFATHWLDEHGNVCPKDVEFSRQCPKGHPLVELANDTFDFNCHQLQCRLCHATCPANSRDAPKWKVCQHSHACCSGYAVCNGCGDSLCVVKCPPVTDAVPSQVALQTLFF
jgi:hypothetical protein